MHHNYIQSHAWDWDCRFVSISRRSQFVSISNCFFIMYEIKYSNFKLFESILGIVTTFTDEEYRYFSWIKTFINWYVMHSLFFYQLWMCHMAFQKSYYLISSIKRMFQLFLIAVLEFVWNKSCARNWDTLRLAWDWDKSAISISGVRLYYWLSIGILLCHRLTCCIKITCLKLRMKVRIKKNTRWY